MSADAIIQWRNNMRSVEKQIKHYCTKRVPAEIFHYTLSQVRTLNTLYALNRDHGGVQLKILAENLHITPAAASEMVDTLVRKGAIVRKNDPSDRRAVRLFVGDALRSRFEFIENKIDELTGRFYETLSAEEQRVFTSVSEKFAKFTSDSSNFPED